MASSRSPPTSLFDFVVSLADFRRTYFKRIWRTVKIKLAALDCDLLFSSLFDLDAQTFDFLVQGRKWDVEAFGSLCLIPPTFFQHIQNYPALAILNNFE